MFSSKQGLMVLMGMGFILWTAPGLTQTAPGGSGGALSNEQRRQVENAAERANQNPPRNFEAPRARALSAGLAAGQAAADLGASPAEAASLAADQVQNRGGDPRDAVDAAVSGAQRAGGDFNEVARAAGEAARDRLNFLDSSYREAHTAASELHDQVDSTRDEVHALYDIRDKIQAEKDALVEHVMSAITNAGRKAGTNPAQIGQALGAAFPKGVLYGMTIHSYIVGSGGEGWTPLERGIMVGNMLLGRGIPIKDAARGAEYAVGTSVIRAGGTQAEYDAAVDMAKTAIIMSGEDEPKKAPEPEPQSRRADAASEQDVLAGLRRVRAGLGGETSNSSVPLPTGGGSGGGISSVAGNAAREANRGPQVRQPRRTSAPQNQVQTQQTAGNQQAAPAQQTTGQQVATAPTAAPPASVSSGFVGPWTATGNCGLGTVQISGSESQPVLNFSGQSIPLSVRDNLAQGTGATLNGNAGSRLTMTVPPENS